MKLLKIFFLFVVTFAANEEFLVADQTNSLKNSETSNWKSWQIPEYNLEFKYPPEAGVKESKMIFFQHPAEAGVSRQPDGLAGDITIDGLHQWPYSIKLNPEFTFESLVFRFPIRFIMLTDAAKMDLDSAKDFHWNETPKISMYPFNFERDKQSMLLAIERLYLGRPRVWEKIEAVTIDRKAGMKMSDWDTIGNEKNFEEIIAVPVSTNKILIVHGGYFPKNGHKFVSSLKTKQQIFSNVVSSVKFLEKQ